MTTFTDYISQKIKYAKDCEPHESVITLKDLKKALEKLMSEEIMDDKEDENNNKVEY